MDPATMAAAYKVGEKASKKVFRPDLEPERRRRMWLRRAIGGAAVLSAVFVGGGAVIARYWPDVEHSAEITQTELGLIRADGEFDQQTLVSMETKVDVGLKVEDHWGSEIPGLGTILEHAPATKSYKSRFNGIMEGIGSTNKFSFHTDYEEYFDEKTNQKMLAVTVTLDDTAHIEFVINRSDPTNDKEIDIEPGFLSSIKDAGSAGIDVLPFVDSDSAQNNRNNVEGNLMVVATEVTAEQCGPVALDVAKDQIRQQIQNEEYNRIKQLYDVQGLPMPIKSASDITVIFPDFFKVVITSQYKEQYDALTNSKDISVSGENDKVECVDMTAGSVGGTN